MTNYGGANYAGGSYYGGSQYGGGLNPYEESSEPREVVPEDRPWYQHRKALGIPYEVTDRDYTYDKDFDEYYYWLHEVPFEQQQDVVPGTKTTAEHTRPHYELVKEKIMKKYGLSEYKFDNRFYEYELDREQNEALDTVAFNDAYTQKHPIQSNIASVTMAPYAAMEGLANGVGSIIGLPRASEDNPDALYFTTQRNAIRGRTNQDIQ